jgi:proline iminopeptidase
MKKKFIIISAVIISILGIGGYIAYQMIMGPMYLPGDLTTKKEYKHLLEAVNKSDKENYFELNDDISLYYEKQGNGKIPVLIIHGGPAIPYEKPWIGLDSLSTNYTFYYYHQRGSGKSTRPFDKFETTNFYKNAVALNNTLGIPAQIADIEQIRKKLGQDKLVLIGHSFGGFLASMYAIEFPQNIESLILVTPAEVIKLPSDGDGLYGAVQKRLPENLKNEYSKYLEKIFDYSNLFEKSEQDLVNETMTFIKYYDIATKQAIESDPENIGGWMPKALYLGMGAKHDYSKHLKQIKAPTLIIYGTDDIIDQNSVQLYLDYIPNVTFKSISGSHFMFNDNPYVFGKIVSDFLDKNKK